MTGLGNLVLCLLVAFVLTGTAAFPVGFVGSPIPRAASPPEATWNAGLGPVSSALAPSYSAITAASTHGQPWSCHGLRALGTPACGSPGPSVGPSPTGARNAGGALPAGASSPPPQATYDFETAFDSADGYLVLLGGLSSSSTYPPAGDMWEFHQGRWSELNPSVMPQNCPGSSLVYDDADGYLLYFGGPNEGWWSSSCASANQTWSYSHGVWTQFHPSSSPSGRYGAAVTNDSRDGYVILFGGLSSSCLPSGYCNDTWTFFRGNWTKLAPSVSPAPREESGLTYDAVGGYALLFGGTSPTYPWFYNDTWTFSGGQWVELFPAVSPPWPQPDALSYDAADGSVVFTSAWNVTASLPEVTWVFEAGNWSQAFNSGPPERLGDATAFDYSDGYLLFFGGQGWSGDLNDTWSFLAGNWTQLSFPAGFVALLSLVPGTIDLGQSLRISTTVLGPNDTYSFSYSNLPPGCVASNSAGLTCLPTSMGVYWITVSVHNSTGGSWNASATAVINAALQLTYFQAVPAVVIVEAGESQFEAGISGGTAVYRYEYTDSVPGCNTTVDLTSALSDFSNCFPSGPGSYSIGLNVTDATGAWVFGVANLSVVRSTPPSPPVVLSFSAVPSSITLGGSVSYLVTATGALPLTYDYSGLPPACPMVNASSISCRPSATGLFVTTITVIDPWGQRAYANATLAVGSATNSPRLTVVSFLASPAAVDVGSVTFFEVFVQGGEAPYTYTYSGVPPGCHSASVSVLGCTPASTGNYSITVNVADSGSNSTAASTALLVVTASTPTSGGAAGSATEPTWLDFGLGVLCAGLGVALIAALFARRPPPQSPRP